MNKKYKKREYNRNYMRKYRVANREKLREYKREYMRKYRAKQRDMELVDK